MRWPNEAILSVCLTRRESLPVLCVRETQALTQACDKADDTAAEKLKLITDTC